MRRLKTFVHVRDANGVAHVFGPDDDVPGWAREAITHPRAWVEDAPKPTAPKPKKSRKPKAPQPDAEASKDGD